MNARLIPLILAVPVFIGAAIAGSRPRVQPKSEVNPPPPPRVAVSIESPTVNEPAPASAKADDVKPEALLGPLQAAMADKTLSVREFRERIPKNLRFTESLGLLAKIRYVDEISQGRVDTDLLWIVFRCGGKELDSLLMERLHDGATNPDERQAIFNEVERFLLAPGPAGPLRIGDDTYQYMKARSTAAEDWDRAIAACLLSTRKTEESRDALWRMGECETVAAVQAAILESLARVVIPNAETSARVGRLTTSFARPGKNLPAAMFYRLAEAQNEIQRKCREAPR